jgi:hypothetical protein
MRRSSVIAVLIATALLTFAPGVGRVHAFEITYLAPPGEPARAFPKPERPVAEIVSPAAPRSGNAMPLMNPASSRGFLQ